MDILQEKNQNVNKQQHSRQEVWPATHCPLSVYESVMKEAKAHVSNYLPGIVLPLAKPPIKIDYQTAINPPLLQEH